MKSPRTIATSAAAENALNVCLWHFFAVRGAASQGGYCRQTGRDADIAEST
jgi:hypothetical protein